MPQSPQRFRQQRLVPQHLVPVGGCKPLKQAITFGSHGDKNDAAVVRGPLSLDETGIRQPIHQLHGTVRLQEQLSGEVPDHDRPAGTHPDHQHCL